MVAMRGTQLLTNLLFRETRARCMSLTVNQWLGGFDSHTRSQLDPRWCNGNTTDFDSVVPGSSPGWGASFRMRPAIKKIQLVIEK